jgi:non-ribosomal peptide synthetase component E (peptide arylation enzyme)
MEELTVSRALQEAASQVPHKAFLHEGHEKVTFEELEVVTDRLASSFLKEGLSRGDNIGIIALNQLEWLYTYFARCKSRYGCCSSECSIPCF